MKNVYILTNGLNSGAVPHLLIDITKHLSDDFDITVGVTVGGDGRTDKGIVNELKSNNVSIKKYRFTLGGSLSSFVSLYQDLLNADIVHTNLQRSNLVGRIIGSLAGVSNILTTEHTPIYRLNKKQLIANYLTIPLANDIISVSENVKESIPLRYCELFQTNVTTIRNTVDKQKIPDDKSLPDGIQLSDDKIHLVSIGRFIKEKNLQTSIRAFAELDKDQFTLTLVGDGPEREYLINTAKEKGVADEINMTGWVNRDTVYKILLHADIVLMPSKQEGMPVSALEAMVTGTPIIASDIRALRETIGEAALFVSPSDVSGWVNAIEDYRTNKNKYEIKADLGMKRINELHDPKNIARQYGELYNSAW